MLLLYSVGHMFIHESLGSIVRGVGFPKRSPGAFPEGVGMNDRQVKVTNVHSGHVRDLVVSSE